MALVKKHPKNAVRNSVILGELLIIGLDNSIEEGEIGSLLLSITGDNFFFVL